MSQAFISIFARRERVVLPERETPLMRVLEPRVLLDAAALETALDVASQAAHSDLAEAYLSPEARERPPAERTPFAVHRSAAFDGLAGFVQEDADENETGAETAPKRVEIVFIDGSLPERDTLLGAVDPDAEVHIIEPGTDGLAFIAETLSGRGGIDAIHILSHGSPGSLSLGDATLDASSLSGAGSAQLAAIGAALSEDADILIYGCDFGAGDEGHRAAAALARATGADIAASDDLTGSAALGGDWDLELRVGEIEASAIEAEAFASVLADEYAIAVVSAPTLSHPNGGTIGEVGTVVRYANAVTFTPDGGGPTQTFDLVGQFVGFTGDVTVTFSGEGNDLGITVNNLGALDTNTGLYPPAAVSINWIIEEPVTFAPTPPATIDLTVDGLYGVGGVPDTGTGVSVDLSIVSAYTLDPSTHLTSDVVADDEDSTLQFFGTQAVDPGGDTDQVSISWGNASDLLMSFHTREQQTLFTVDGNREIGFAGGVTQLTRILDANGAAGGIDHSVVYQNAGTLPGAEAGVAIAAIDAEMFDIDDLTLQRLTVTIEGALAGDELIFDANVADRLGLDVTVDIGPPDYVLTAETRDFNNGTALRSFRDFLASIAYRNDQPDGNFDRSTPRTITMTFSDGIDNAPVATTTVTFAEALGAATVTPILEATQEDVDINRNGGDGLLSHVANPSGYPLTIDGASLNGTALTIGSPFTTPIGSTITIRDDGGFDFSPPADGSGTEIFDIVIDAGAGGTIATSLMINVTSDPDMPTLSLTLPTASTDEDAPTAALNISAAPTDPTETFQVRIVGLMEGAIVEDQAGNSHRSEPDEETFIDVTGWDLANLRVLPLEDSDDEITFDVVARSTEDDGRYIEATQTVTYTVDAVADAPELIVQSAIAPVDGTVELFRFIEVNLRDEDGSESVTAVRITGIVDEGVTFQVNGIDRPVDYSAGPNDGVLALTMADVAALTMRGPNDGQQHSYRYFVSADATETAPNGAVTLASAATGPVALNIAFDSSDDPVDAIDDAFAASSGQSMTLPLTDNDVALDGGMEIFQINGQAIGSTSVYTLPGGEGTLRLDGRGGVVFDASADYSGTFVFTYSMRDFDGDADTANVVVTVDPVWNLTASSTTTAEGGTLDFSITLDGSLRPGESAAVTPGIVYGTAVPADIDDLDAALTAAAAADPNFTFDGTRLVFDAPPAAYDVTSGVGSTFTDIGATGTVLNMNTGASPVPLTHSFFFNGREITQIHVMPDGVISLDGPQAPAPNGALDGTAFGGDGIIAPWWDTIDTTTGSVTVLAEGQAGARTTTVQWIGTPAGGTGTVTFQAVLFEANGAIEFRYLDVDAGGAANGGGSATIGLQGDGIGTQFSQDTASVADGMFVRFEAPTVVRPQLDVQLGIVDDVDFEPVETFSLTLAGATGSLLGTDTLLASIAYSDNNPPVAQDDTATTPKNEAVVIDVVGGATAGAQADADPDGQSLVLTQLDGTAVAPGDTVTLASGAIVTFETDGTVSYDPNGQFNALLAGQTAQDTFQYTVFDGLDGSATATVTVDIEGINVPPRIDLDGTFGGGAGVSLTYNDTQGRIAIAPTAIVTDVEDDDFDMVGIGLVGFLQGAAEEIVIGSATVQYGVSLTTQATIAGVTFDIVYDGIQTIAVTRNGGGTFDDAAIEALIRAVTYDNTAALDIGGDRFVHFSAHAAGGTSAVVTATIDVVGSNAAPDAVDDGSPGAPFATGTEDTALGIDPSMLTANDSDPEGDAFQITGYGNETGGRIEIDAMGNVTFVPDDDHEGMATFDYTITDTFGGQDTATVTLNFTGVNDAPHLDLNGSDPGTLDAASTYIEGGAAVQIATGDAFLADVDDVNLEAATITFSGAVGDRLNVGGLPPGISVTASPATATTGLTAAANVQLTFVGTASQLAYFAALQAVTFDTVSDNPATAPRDFTVIVSDGSLTSAPAHHVVQVVPTNDAPVAVADAVQQVAEDQVLRLSPALLMANDYDPDGETPVFDRVDNAVGGTVTIDANGDIVFTPTPDTFGAASFDYTIRDAAGLEDTRTVAVNVTPVNDAPVLSHAASPGAQVTTYHEGDAPIPLVTGFAIADVDNTTMAAVEVHLVNGQPGDLIAATTNAPGITVNAPGALAGAGPLFVTLVGPASIVDFEAVIAGLTFSSTSDFPSEVQREVRIRAGDGAAVSTPVVVHINVTEVNDLPDVPSLSPFPTNEDNPVSIATIALTGAANDRDGDPLTISALGVVTGGSAVITASGVTFTPDPDYTGPASFEYTISDGRGGEVTNTAVIAIQPVDDAPVVSAGSGAAGPYVENGAPIPLLDPALSVTDVDSGLLDSALVQIGAQAGDLVTHDPLPPGLTISINPAGPMPGAGAIIVTITGDASPADYEAALRALRFSSASEYPSEAPRPIQFAVQDQSSASDIAYSTLTVQAVNDVPVAGPNPQLQAVEDTSRPISQAELLANITDADLDALQVTGVSAVAGGTVEPGPGGSFVFVPTPNYFGPAGFDFTVSDGNGGVITAHADIDVAAVDDAPILDLSSGTAGIDYAFTYIEDDGPTRVVGTDILVDDVDTPQLVGATVTLVNGQIGDVLTLGTLPAAISASVVPSGPLAAPGPITIYLTGAEIPSVYGFALSAIQYSSASQTPSETPRIIEFTVNDGTSASALARTQVTVVSVNDVPVANDVPLLTTAEDTPIDFSPVANDTDADGDPLIVTAIAGTPVVAGGSVTLADGRATLLADGRTLRFEPRANFFGTVSFAYTVSDGQASDDANISIDVTSVNDVPVIGPDAPIVHDEDTSASIDPTANDVDADGDPLRVASIDGQAVSPGGSVMRPEGELRVGIDGRTVTFVPTLNWNGRLTVPYSVTDDQGGVANAELIFDVTPVNDPLQVVATPPAVTFDDGSPVALAMDAYLTDPDGDPIIYTASGLPAGLTIHPTTALISGQLASDASTASPYFITVTGDDGMGSQVGVSFQLTAVNTVPVGAPDPTVPVADGDIVSYAGGALFTDADGDALAFTALGLPAWLQIDGATGEVFGMVPFDASQLGPVTLQITATDHAGASDTVSVTLVPSNPAPVVVRPLGFMIADEGQSIARDLNAFIADGGRDGDALTWTVTGLPAGVTFDPATATISGTPDEGTRSLQGYDIVVTVDDGQGGVLNTTFVFYVGDVERPDEDEFDIDVLPDAGEDRAPIRARVALGFDAPTLDRSGTVDLDRERLIVGTAVSAVADLGSIDDVAFQTDGFEPRLRAGLRGEIFPASFGAGGIEPVERLRPADGGADASDDDVPVPATRPTGADIEISARIAPGRVVVTARDVAAPDDMGRTVAITPRGGVEGLTQKVLRNGMVAFGVPAELLDLSLTVAVEKANDMLSVVDVDIDVKDGSVKIVGPDDVRDAQARVAEPRGITAAKPLPQYPPII